MIPGLETRMCTSTRYLAVSTPTCSSRSAPNLFIKTCWTWKIIRICETEKLTQIALDKIASVWLKVFILIIILLLLFLKEIKNITNLALAPNIKGTNQFPNRQIKIGIAFLEYCNLCICERVQSKLVLPVLVWGIFSKLQPGWILVNFDR